jgi:hypothetical protein
VEKVDQQHSVFITEIHQKKKWYLMEEHLPIENGKQLKKKSTNAIFFVIIATIFCIMVIVGMNF